MPQQLGNNSRSRPTSEPLAKVTRGHSCTQCSQRKVKCDGKRPCSKCIKGSRASECRSARPAGLLSLMRDGSSSSDHALVQRLRHYEGLLTAHGIPLTSERVTGDGSKYPLETTSHTPRLDDGHVIMQRGHPRFVDNAIWNPLGSEFDDESYAGIDEDDQSNEDEEPAPASPEILLMSHWQRILDASDYTGPDINHTLKLWQIFLENFNPLVKLFHAPTVQQLICEVITADPLNLPKSTKALMASIYLCAVTTLTDEQCISQLSHPKTALVRRFSCLAQQALVQAEFLRSTDPAVLQALTLYLLASRSQLDEQTLWLLTGLASRLAQAMGLHREQSLKQLSPFEAELRRRLWWQIAIMDSRSGQLLGATGEASFHDDADVKPPVNVNDSDLSPYMREPLASHDGPTEMLFCTIRLKIGDFMRRLRLARLTSRTTTDSEDLIDAFEKSVESILKQCDTSIPLHLISVFLGRSAICQLRFSILQGNQKGKTPDVRSRLFNLALEILGFDNQCYSNKTLQKFLWHVGNNFPFQSLIYVLANLLERPPGGHIAQQAWSRVNRVYEDHPELLSNVKNPLCFALGNLTLKAWNRHAQAPAPSMDTHSATATVRAVSICPAIEKLKSQRVARGTRGAIEGSCAEVSQPGPGKSMYAWPQAMDVGGDVEQLDSSVLQFFSRYLPEDEMALWGSQEHQW